jgi:hypothetical protein
MTKNKADPGSMAAFLGGVELYQPLTKYRGETTMAFADAKAGATILDANMKTTVALAEGCIKGDLLGYSSGWKRALATTGTAIQAKCVALMDGKNGDVIAVSFGKVLLGGRLSGMTITNPLYAAEGSDNGAYTETAPSTGGDCNTIIGYSISATEAIIDPLSRAPTTA